MRTAAAICWLTLSALQAAEGADLFEHHLRGNEPRAPRGWLAPPAAAVMTDLAIGPPGNLAGVTRALRAPSRSTAEVAAPAAASPAPQRVFYPGEFASDPMPYSAGYGSAMDGAYGGPAMGDCGATPVCEEPCHQPWWRRCRLFGWLRPHCHEECDTVCYDACEPCDDPCQRPPLGARLIAGWQNFWGHIWHRHECCDLAVEPATAECGDDYADSGIAVDPGMPVDAGTMEPAWQPAEPADLEPPPAEVRPGRRSSWNSIAPPESGRARRVRRAPESTLPAPREMETPAAIDSESSSIEGPELGLPPTQAPAGYETTSTPQTPGIPRTPNHEVNDRTAAAAARAWN